MALAVLPDQIIVKSRDEWLALYLRSHKLRAPLASVAQDSEPYVTGSALSDQLNILSENARQMSRGIPLASLSSKALDAELAALGLPSRFPETGSQGSVAAQTSTFGSTVPADTEGTDANGQIFRVTTTATYVNGQNIPIAAKSTGPTTNLAAGTRITWSAPPGGLVPVAFVVRQTDGSGLSGGRLAETDDEVRNRISDAYANPPSAGNDAAYQAAIEFSKGHGVAVQKAFTYPAALGPGTTAFCFTLSPAAPGSSRIPNATQIQQVRDYTTGQFPGDDQLLDCILQAQNVDIVVTVIWADGADDWIDPVPWPPYYTTAATPRAVVVTAATSPTSFSVDCAAGARSGAVAPQSGQSIGVYDQAAGVFRKKRILSFTGTGPWVITVDTANGVSDTTYTPVVTQRVCPWSDSLQTLVPPTLAYYGTLGPGEQFASFFDPGQRQRRNPRAPRSWPSTISNRLVTDYLNVEAVADAIVVEGLGTHTTVGTPGVSSFLIELGYLSAFPSP